MSGAAEWFMDYRNSDGGVAEMCGNGVRVFARYLQRAGLAGAGDLAVATRAGVRRVHLAKSASDGTPGDVTVDMGRAVLPAAEVTVTVGGALLARPQRQHGQPARGRLRRRPGARRTTCWRPLWSPRPTPIRTASTSSSWSTADRATSPCGCTSAAPARPAPAAPAPARSWWPPPAGTALDPAVGGVPVTYTVDLPGGRLVITELPDGTVEMTGPAVIVAEGVIDPSWLGSEVRANRRGTRSGGGTGHFRAG